MYDMLAAFHFANYLERRRREERPGREPAPDDRFDVALHLVRKMRQDVPDGWDCRH